MKVLWWVCATLGLLVCAADAAAAVQPSFQLDACSWNATHVVVVSEGGKIDGDVEVLDTWKGDLKKGDRITVPALAAFAPEKERTISEWWFKRGEEKDLPTMVTCSRMVLFLIRKQERPEGGRLAATEWLPAAGEADGFKVSTTWIEGDRAFAFVQQINPGPSVLVSQGKGERWLRQRVDGVATAQAALAEALQGDAQKLEKAVGLLLRSESEFVRRVVITELGNSGVKGLPAIRRVLNDDALSKYHGQAVEALVKAGGADAGPELADLLKQELAFWKKVGPGLPKGWWNGSGVKWDEVEGLRGHYGRAHAAINGLGKVRHAEGRGPLTEFRNYWQSLPQLSDIAQLSKACDTALEALPRP